MIKADFSVYQRPHGAFQVGIPFLDIRFHGVTFRPLIPCSQSDEVAGKNIPLTEFSRCTQRTHEICLIFVVRNPAKRGTTAKLVHIGRNVSRAAVSSLTHSDMHKLINFLSMASNAWIPLST